LAAVACSDSGALGTSAGVADVRFDHAPMPDGVIAATWNEYRVPFVKFETFADVAVVPVETMAVVHVTPSKESCTWYPVITPPAFDGADQLSCTDAGPGVAPRFVGAPGSNTGTARIAVLDAPVATALMASTR